MSKNVKDVIVSGKRNKFRVRYTAGRKWHRVTARSKKAAAVKFVARQCGGSWNAYRVKK